MELEKILIILRGKNEVACDVAADLLVSYAKTSLKQYQEIEMLMNENKRLEAELAAYRTAEQDGTLLRLPCNENSMLYSPRKNDVLEQKVQYITIGDGDTSVAVSFKCDYECVGCPHNHPYRNYEAGDGGCDGEDGFGVFLIKDFGKTVFLTRPDAEAALKEQEANDGKRVEAMPDL